MTLAIELLKRLVACPSVNPQGMETFGPPFGEERMNDLLADLLSKWGADVEAREVLPRRSNLLARFAGRDRSRTLALEAHSDTVLVSDMIIPPFDPVVREGRLYGRGACDTKGGMAAMLAGIRRVLEEDGAPPTDLCFAATCNEEAGAAGASALAEGGFRADGVVVAEPTELKIIHAHKGAARWRIATEGVAAHSSAPEMGVNAISMMRHVMGAIEGPVAALLARREHPLLGRPTICIGAIHGGTQVNVVPARCTIEVDRRLIPGETAEAAQREIEEELDKVRRAGTRLAYSITRTQLYPPLEQSPDSPLVRALRTACETVLGKAELSVAAYGTDAGHFSRSGLSCVIFGPGSIRQAHTADEFIETAQVEQAAAVYAELIRRF